VNGFGDLEAEWSALVSNRADPTNPLFLQMPMAPSTSGGSGSFRALGSDGHEWFVKPPNHNQGGKVLATEYIVGRLGALLGHGVCAVRPMRIDASFVGWEFQPMHPLVEGWGNASLAVPSVVEERVLDHRTEDDNRVRHTTLFALYDWAWGGDAQWLYRTDDGSTHSHDHGWYFPPEGADWTVDELRACHDLPRLPGWDAMNLDRGAVATVSDRVLNVGREEIRSILQSVPPAWPVSDVELCVLGAFLEWRRTSVAAQLTAL